MTPGGKILFSETQYFRVKWLWWLILLCMLSSVGVTLGLAIVEKEKIKEAWIAMAFVIPLEAVILYFFYITRLETVVSSEGIFYRWLPFQKNYRVINKAEIEEAQLRTGPALSYGFHWVPGYGRVHNMGPGKGFQFVLKNKKKIFLGTQQPPSFQNALQKIVSVS